MTYPRQHHGPARRALPALLALTVAVTVAVAGFGQPAPPAAATTTSSSAASTAASTVVEQPGVVESTPRLVQLAGGATAPDLLPDAHLLQRWQRVSTPDGAAPEVALATIDRLHLLQLPHQSGTTSDSTPARIEVIATAADAAAGLPWTPGETADAWWDAHLDPTSVEAGTTGRPGIVAVVCLPGYLGDRYCVLRASTPDGQWETVLGGGTDWVDPQMEPDWSIDDSPAPTGRDPLGLRLARPESTAFDPSRGIVYLTQGDPDDHSHVAGSLWAFDLATRELTRVAGPAELGGSDGVTWQAEVLAVLPDGRLLASNGTRLKVQVIDPVAGSVADTAMPYTSTRILDVQAGVGPAGPVTVWTGEASHLVRYALAADARTATVVDRVRPDVVSATLFPLERFVLHDPAGVLVYGEQGVFVPAVHRYETGPSAPAAPGSVVAVPGDRKVTVSWSAADGYGNLPTSYTLSVQPGGVSVTVPAEQQSAVVTGLANGTTYTVSVQATNAVGTGPGTVSGPVVPKDVTAPPKVALGTVSPGIGQVTLRWVPPSASTVPDFAGVTVVRKPGTGVPTSPTDGTVVYRGTATAFTSTGLSAGTGYGFAVYARDSSGNHSPAATVLLRGTKVAGKPAATVATYSTKSGLTHTVTVRDAVGLPVASRPVTLQVRARGASAWSSLGSKSTSSTGTVSWSHRPSRNAEYRAVFSGSGSYLGAVSGIYRVDVRPAVSSSVSATSVKRGTTVALSGTVSPKHAGQVVRLERHTSKGWVLVTSQKLSSTSTYRFTVKQTGAAKVSYRVHLPAHADHVAGISVTRAITWS